MSTDATSLAVARSIAVIPARGGSKRIPRKNIRPFLGVPLLARTIALLRKTAHFQRIIVSTDDPEIAAVATSAGAEVPFLRPANLADDFTGTAAVIAHTLRHLQGDGDDSLYACCVYPAAVLLKSEDLDGARAQLAGGASFVFSATSFPYPIQRALRLTKDGGTEMFWPENRTARSQDLEPAFHDAGMFYWGMASSWLSGRTAFSPDARMMILPRYRVQDIDTEEDWERAELIFRMLNEHGNA
jgi:N-acylneuraminate cytidylyltransferase